MDYEKTKLGDLMIALNYMVIRTINLFVSNKGETKAYEDYGRLHKYDNDWRPYKNECYHKFDNWDISKIHISELDPKDDKCTVTVWVKRPEWISLLIDELRARLNVKLECGIYNDGPYFDISFYTKIDEEHVSTSIAESELKNKDILYNEVFCLNNKEGWIQDFISDLSENPEDQDEIESLRKEAEYIVAKYDAIYKVISEFMDSQSM